MAVTKEEARTVASEILLDALDGGAHADHLNDSAPAPLEAMWANLFLADLLPAAFLGNEGLVLGIDEVPTEARDAIRNAYLANTAQCLSILMELEFVH